MKHTILFCLALLLLISTLAQAQPSILANNGVLNASSFLPDVARGSWFVIFGSGLGPAAISVHYGLPYPTALAGTSITFTPASGGAPISALMYYTMAGQVAGMLPSSTAAGTYDVAVTYNGQTSAPVRINVVERNFGFATQSSNGQGPAQATYGGYDLNRFTDSSLGQWGLRPAKPGQAMVLWGTGLGADPKSDTSGGTSGDQTAAAQVQVIVDGIAVTPAYAGRSSGSPGLDQINFTIPSQVTPSCFVSLQVSAGGKLSNLGSIAVAAAGQSACSSPTLTEAQLQKLDKGGTLTIGSLYLGKTEMSLNVPGFGMMKQQTENVSGSFGQYTVDAVATAGFSLVQSGACFVLKRTGTTDQINTGVPPKMLDAGNQLTLNGPNAANRAVPRQSDMSYNAMMYSSGMGGMGGSGSPTLVQGAYTLAGTGGLDVGAFSAGVDLPGNFDWTNEDSITDPIPRASPLNVTWTGGGQGLVEISGAAMAQAGGTPENPVYSATVFVCTAPASAGAFTVPSSILVQLPVVASDETGNTFGTLSVMAVPDPAKGQGKFTAPLTAGGTIDLGMLTYTVGSMKTTGYN